MTSPTRFEIAAAAIALLLFSTLAAAAQTAPRPPAVMPQSAALTFEQFKAQQLQQLQQAQAFVAQRLAAQDSPPDQRQRLEHQQALLARFAGLPPDRQDEVLHRRFDRLDAMVDATELQASRRALRDHAQAKRDAGGKSDDFWPSQN